MAITDQVTETIQKQSMQEIAKLAEEQGEFYRKMVQMGIAKKQEYNIPLSPNGKPATFLVR